MSVAPSGNRIPKKKLQMMESKEVSQSIVLQPQVTDARSPRSTSKKPAKVEPSLSMRSPSSMVISDEDFDRALAEHELCMTNSALALLAEKEMRVTMISEGVSGSMCE